MSKSSIKIFDLEGKIVEETNLPEIFETPLRPDIIKRAVLAIQSNRLQKQGRDILAGKRTTAESRGVGLGMSRIPRTKGHVGRAAFAPGTVGGRSAHPPKSEKKIIKKISKKEKRLAFFSAIAATASKKTVAARGHLIEDNLNTPLIVTDIFEDLTKTKEVEMTLTNIGLLSDINRVKRSEKIRAGKGKFRGRKMKHAVGPLIVVTENKRVVRAARNILGVDVVTVKNYGSLHFFVSVIFFILTGFATIIYGIEQRSYLIIVAFAISIISWLIYFADIFSLGIAVPEIISSTCVSIWIFYSSIKTLRKNF